MNYAEQMLGAIETHYAEAQPDGSVRIRRYTDMQRQELLNRYQGYPEKYLLDLYDVVTSMHEQRFRTLPDKAVFVKAENKLSPPATYREPKKALPEVNLEAEIERERRRQKQEEGKDPVEHIQEQERRRIRSKKHKTKWEGWWLYTLEKYGRYTPMPPDWDEDSYDKLVAKQERTA